MSTLNKISLDGNVYNISNFHYIENNSASNPFIITEHEPGIYVVKSSNAGVVPGVLYSKYIDSEDYNIKEDYFCGFLCLTDTSIDETYKRKNIGYIFDASKALAHPCYTEPAPSGTSLTRSAIGLGNTVVETRNNQTIGGKKTFTILPESSAAPTTDNQLTNKKYVDDSIPTKTSQLTNDSNYTTLYSVENNYADGTTICGWSSTATDGQNMTSDYGMTPAMAAGIQAGKKYEWASRVSYSGTNSAVCYYASHDHGTADDGTSYNYVSAKIGNGTDWISFCWDDSTVYFGTTWPGSSGGKACFSGDTLVWTSEGEKKIKDIQIGDRVMSINIEKDIIEPREITKLVNHKEEEILVITTKDGTIKVTGSHPFYEKKKGKVNARILEVGDELMDDKFGLHKITKIETKALNDTVYEIVVDGTHNYFISKQHIRVFNEPSVLKD